MTEYLVIFIIGLIFGFLFGVLSASAAIKELRQEAEEAEIDNSFDPYP